MDMQIDDEIEAAAHDYGRVLRLLRSLPDHCALDVGALADQVGADKLELIQWVRADITFARLIESKVTK
ncbi:hypothetical protein [Steroidobacter cummioxidans]|uniref:hypothetical protein n=1 Tax=Steroidobacter cummioxidans TaxID=1803913 RepID=UPI000E31272A|nr:hypothetical protein [Steroidobacter cummioxidans]